MKEVILLEKLMPQGPIPFSSKLKGNEDTGCQNL